MKEQKADGYVAWHPKRGIAEFNDERGFELKRKPFRLLEIFKHKKDAIDDMAYAEAGWRIRPVKLVFLDEPPTDEEKKE